MIQELLGGTNNSSLINGGERKMFSMINNIPSPPQATTTLVAPHHHPPPLLSPSPSPSSSSSAAAGNSAPAAENLRCPRCDSANTKFCYYNNYNLTQPRHFCKTCRRYWTKGGALRNVPIGGGCRKNKSPSSAAAAAASSSSSPSSHLPSAAAAMKAIAGKVKIPDPGPLRPGFGAFDLSPGPSPILWGSPQSSHLLALIRSSSASQNPNPNPNPSLLPAPLSHAAAINAMSVKEEGSSAASCAGSHMVSSVDSVNGAMGGLGRSLGMDVPVGQAPSLGLCSSFWRSSSLSSSPINNAASFAVQADHQQSNGNAGIQELYQRLRSSSSSSSTSLLSGNNSYYNDQTAMVLTHHQHGHVESAPVNGGGGDQLGFWNNNNNSAFSWSTDHLPTTTTNGAYP